MARRAQLGAVNCTRGTVLTQQVRVADGRWSRLVGLLATPEKTLGKGQGLWLVPCRGVHMVGMRYPIDAVYLDRDLHVVHVEERLRPWRLGAVRRSAWGVLELAVGSVAATGTAIGDRIEWQPASAASAAWWGGGGGAQFVGEVASGPAAVRADGLVDGKMIQPLAFVGLEALAAADAVDVQHIAMGPEGRVGEAGGAGSGIPGVFGNGGERSRRHNIQVG